MTVTGKMKLGPEATFKLWTKHEALKDENKRLKERLERSQKDAARYRWLRDDADGNYGIYDIGYEIIGLFQGEKLDEAVDKAMAAGEAG